ncbi:hypothetical protein B0H19DRAFT_1068022 [Mycena capillaripes]|nr:hypothetical protein B0H19DRAFT_1068022 [Mycena capillaripes]
MTRLPVRFPRKFYYFSPAHIIAPNEFYPLSLIPMDPSLRLETLSALPFSARVNILTICVDVLYFSSLTIFKRMGLLAADGSLKHLRQIECIKNDVSEDVMEKLVVYLPVFFANLDIARIPSEDKVDNPCTFTEGAVICAEISLDCIYSLTMTFGPGIPPGAFPDLWPRMWAWIQFFDSYREQFPGDNVAGSGFLIFATAFCRFGSNLGLIPGFRRIVARAWGPILDCPNNLRQAMGIDRVTELLFSLVRVKTRSDLEEVIQGAGGSITELASLVVGYIDCITADGGKPTLRTERRLNGTLFNFVDDVDRVLASVAFKGNVLGPFSAALLASSIVRSLIAILDTLLRIDSGDRLGEFFPILHRSLQFLRRILLAAPDREAMTEALDAGLIRVLLLCGAWGNFNETLKSLIEDILPTSLIHYYELSILERELLLNANPKPLASKKSFQPFLESSMWKQFVAMAEPRIAILHGGESELQHLKACDNAKCCKIGDRNAFQRCSGCLGFYYCSPECQKLDWSDGDHHAYCGAHPSQRLSELRDLRVRERSFLRALLTHDYNEAKHSRIYPEQALRYPKDGPEPRFFTLFDYRTRRVKIEVHPVDSVLSQQLSKQSGWWNDVQRAACSNGRMELHVLALPAQPEARGETRYFMIPLRKETSRTHDVVTDVGRSLSSDARVESVLKEERMKNLRSLKERTTH